MGINCLGRMKQEVNRDEPRNLVSKVLVYSSLWIFKSPKMIAGFWKYLKKWGEWSVCNLIVGREEGGIDIE